MDKSYFVLGSMVGVTLLSGAILISGGVLADDSSVTTTTITVPVSCSMIGTVVSQHTAEIPNGIDSRGNDYYPDGIGSTTLKAYCNDNEGFSIYAVGYSDDTIGNTYLRDSTLGQSSDIQTGTTFSGANSAWAMKIGVTTGNYPAIVAGSTGDSEKQSGDPDYSTWQAIPSSYTRVAYRNSATDVNNNNIASADGSSVTTTYATYISTTQNAGIYVGKVKYTLVHPATKHPLEQTATSGCINYFPNGSGVVGTMGCQSISASATSATLYASNFIREGYGFAGWSDVYDYATNANANFYGPNEDITFTAGQYTGTNDGLALYAVWVKSAGNLQDSSKVAEICGTGTGSLTTAPTNGTANLSSVTALTDTRDNQTYAIAKLADGKCWMIENLRLDNTAELTTLNTNNPLNDGTNVTLKHNYTDTDTYNTLSATNNQAYNVGTAPDGWCTSNSAACDDQSRLRTDNTANRVTYTDNQNMSTDANLYSYGNYYNWYSATAGRGTYSFNTNNNSTAGDLCPAGWHLPTGGMAYASGNTSGVNVTGDASTFREFYNLGYKLMDEVKTAYEDTPNNGYAYYSSNTTNTAGNTATKAFRRFPNNYLYSGYVRGGSLDYRGARGYYWSSTAYNSLDAYHLFLSSSSAFPGTYGYSKYIGWALRCIASS